MTHHNLTVAETNWGDNLRTKLGDEARTGDTTLVDVFVIADDSNSYVEILVDDGRPYVIISASLRKHKMAKEVLAEVARRMANWKNEPEPFSWRLL